MNLISVQRNNGVREVVSATGRKGRFLKNLTMKNSNLSLDGQIRLSSGTNFVKKRKYEKVNDDADRRTYITVYCVCAEIAGIVHSNKAIRGYDPVAYFTRENLCREMNNITYK
jgi:hypothetical protein